MQPPTDTEITIRVENGETAVEIMTGPALLTISKTDLAFTVDNLRVDIPLVELIELLLDLAKDENDTVSLAPSARAVEVNRAALRAWLLSRPGTLPASNGFNAGFLLRDDYDPIGYHA